MRAAMYMPGLRPGSMSWTIYQEFARALRGEGMEFEILTDAPQDPPSVEGTTFLPLARGRLPLDRLAAPLTRNPRFVATARTLARYLREHRDLDVLYMEIAYPLAAAANLARRLTAWRGELVVTPMGEDILVVPEASYGTSRYLFPRRALTWTLQGAGAIRCISPMVEERIGPWANRPTEVIPLNVAPSTIAASRCLADRVLEERSAARRAMVNRLDLGREHLILSLGRLHPFKGLHFLVEAMRQLPSADLVIVGPSMTVASFGDYRDHLQRHAERHGIADQVRFLDGVPHQRVLETMAAADVLVVPSILESMNRVCVEASATGTPFVVTETTGVAGYLDEEGVGRTAPPGNPAALAAAIEPVLTGQWQRDPAASRRLVDRFDANNIAPRLARLFEAALRR